MSDLPIPDDSDLASARRLTPARVLVGRAGSAYRTPTLLELRADHAAARDAVWEDVIVERDLPGLDLFTLSTQATSKQEYLLRPDLGRRLDDASRHLLSERCERGADLQLVVGDGLSAAAVRAQVPALLPLLLDLARQRGWKLGRTFAVRHCRVGVLNDIGDILDPAVVVLLIGERPGLTTAVSLSAYMAHRPRSGDTDANRNLISNIHERGVRVKDAVPRILALAAKLRQMQTSGVEVKEDLPPTLEARR